MHIVSALFVEGSHMRAAGGGAARLDLTGVMFSLAAPRPVPVTVDPHLEALIYCPDDHAGNGVFEVVFTNTIGAPTPDIPDSYLARNVSPFAVEPGKFTNRRVKAELLFDDYSQVFAHCRVSKGPWHVVPFTLLPPAS